MSVSNDGYVRVATVSPAVSIANPEKNARRIIEKYELLSAAECSVVLTPELSVTGYTCEDLFLTQDLRTQTQEALSVLAAATNDQTLLIVGAPLKLEDGRLLNAAFVLGNGRILGAVPKIANPNYGEFYEKRWFSSGLGVDCKVTVASDLFRTSTKQLFRAGTALCGIEICEDLWMPQPPSAQHAVNGATVLLNPSASTEQVSKADYRRDLVRMQSGSCLAGYAYAGCSHDESTKDVVYGGHMLIAENAQILAESERFSVDQILIADIDHGRLTHERSLNTTFHSIPRDESYSIVAKASLPEPRYLLRKYSQQPFVPQTEASVNQRASEILQIQVQGLARRIHAAQIQRLVIGLSGGLDSTLALLVCLETQKQLAWDVNQIMAVTMPGPGTSKQTLQDVLDLSEAVGLAISKIDINKSVDLHLADLNHSLRNDITFENTQARTRTQLLFNLANKHNGIVVGTGDLSELALGWCTFNGDHMSNYNVNASIPKTLVKHLVSWYAQHRATNELDKVLQKILKTPITPELLSIEDGQIKQKTEEIIGPYELHDFFLYHFMRTGASAKKIMKLAESTFVNKYSLSDLKKWITTFFERFHSQQFKRTTLPPGPKVGTVSLSPRGDWRMPDETRWLNTIE